MAAQQRVAPGGAARGGRARAPRAWRRRCPRRPPRAARPRCETGRRASGRPHRGRPPDPPSCASARPQRAPEYRYEYTLPYPTMLDHTLPLTLPYHIRAAVKQTLKKENPAILTQDGLRRALSGARQGVSRPGGRQGARRGATRSPIGTGRARAGSSRARVCAPCRCRSGHTCARRDCACQHCSHVVNCRLTAWSWARKLRVTFHLWPPGEALCWPYHAPLQSGGQHVWPHIRAPREPWQRPRGTCCSEREQTHARLSHAGLGFSMATSTASGCGGT